MDMDKSRRPTGHPDSLETLVEESHWNWKASCSLWSCWSIRESHSGVVLTNAEPQTRPLMLHLIICEVAISVFTSNTVLPVSSQPAHRTHLAKLSVTLVEDEGAYGRIK